MKRDSSRIGSSRHPRLGLLSSIKFLKPLRGCLWATENCFSILVDLNKNTACLLTKLQRWRGQMSNIAGKAYAMNVITPMPRWCTWIQTALFMIARITPQTLSGLLGLKLIHFARWVIIRRNQWPDPAGNGAQPLDEDYMLFLSNFNGTWDQYIDAFADGIPQGLDLFWYASTKYPHSIPISTFKSYITANQIQTNYYYNATPGYAPIASVATQNADVARNEFIKDLATKREAEHAQP